MDLFHLLKIGAIIVFANVMIQWLLNKAFGQPAFFSLQGVAIMLVSVLAIGYVATKWRNL